MSDNRKEAEEKMAKAIHFYGKPLPIPQIQMPRKIIRFKRIDISYIDRNVIAFLNRFRPLFGACPFYLYMETTSNDHTLEFILRNIWPMIGNKISDMQLSVKCFHCLRKFVPSILTDCSSLRVLAFNIADVFAEFPADDSAMASDGQASVGQMAFHSASGRYAKGVEMLQNIEVYCEDQLGDGLLDETPGPSDQQQK
ncbi:hypothetical protein niasHT_018996 [Heterodera trifolii]|uniref:Uncharacterized protein n=1 Tax=Heterodera trifolii TaxID=157864 RepID=A0ABD2LJH9_9BILA